MTTIAGRRSDTRVERWKARIDYSSRLTAGVHLDRLDLRTADMAEYLGRFHSAKFVVMSLMQSSLPRYDFRSSEMIVRAMPPDACCLSVFTNERECSWEAFDTSTFVMPIGEQRIVGAIGFSVRQDFDYFDTQSH